MRFFIWHLHRYVLAGIVSWGLECGKKDVPGVYADITEGLCFIDYATKCIHGKKYQQFYDYPQCTNWLEDLIATYVSICQTSIFHDLLNYIIYLLFFFRLESTHNGVDAIEGGLKKARDFSQACNGFIPRNPSFG